MLDNMLNFNMDMFSLEGKVALVTGGNSGLGLSYTIAFAKAGAKVAVVSVTDTTDEVAEILDAMGESYLFIKADITSEGSPQNIVDQVVSHFGHIDILVNNAGRCVIEKDVLNFDRPKWDAMVSLNLTAAFEMSHAVAKHFIPQRSGKIINIASMFSYLGGQWSPAYSATKHGIVGLTKSYCDELAQFNIQVTGIAPGYFATPMTETTRNDEEANKKIISHIPAERWGDLKDLMGAAVFLASSASNYINGSVIDVDGGYLVR